MILEMDMGNTRIKWRIRDGGIKLSQGFVGTEESLTSLSGVLNPYLGAIQSVLVVSVVGDQLEQKLVAWSIASLGVRPQFVRTGFICGAVRNGYHEPLMLGADRWLAINAAYRLTMDTCVVISFGTATTLDLLASDGEHLGGFIAPGFGLMLATLTSAAREVRLESSSSELSLSPGITTTDAVYSAIAAMLTGLIDNGVRQLRAHSCDVECQIVFTGGDAERFLPFYPQARLVPDLVLDGIACVLENS